MMEIGQDTPVHISVSLWRGPVGHPLRAADAGATYVMVAGSRTMPQQLMLAWVLDHGTPEKAVRLDVPRGHDHLYVFVHGGLTRTVIMVRTAEGDRPAEQVDRKPPCWRIV